jgi:type I site-specific restriction endonuclease
MNDNEARARVLIDTQLADLGWDIHDSNAVRYEVALPDRGGFADYVLCDRHGRALAVIEAKRFSIDPGSATAQARHYANNSACPTSFANGRETLFWEWQREAFPEPSRPSSSRTTSSAAPPPWCCASSRAGFPSTPASPAGLPDRLHRHPVP